MPGASSLIYYQEGRSSTEHNYQVMADMDVEAIAALRKKRQFKKFMFRGVELDKLLDLSHEVSGRKLILRNEEVQSSVIIDKKLRQ